MCIRDRGCTDSSACNYDSDATEDDGSCTYAEENYDCDGNCTAEVDCAGDCGGSAELDECGECNGDGSSCIEITVDIYYDSSEDIAGFQFNVDGASVTGASGGAAAANGFTVSASSTTVLGFSFTGSVIPAGSGVLTTLTVQGEPCMSGLVLSSTGGQTLDSEVVDCLTASYSLPVVAGCTDSNACNYDSDATEDDGSCTYAEANYDCDGNCTAEVDCAGDCAGSSVVDDCGVCNGDGSSCAESSVDILYDFDVDVAGFQFNIDGASVTGASGGAAAANGFTVSASSTTVLGLSLIHISEPTRPY